MAAGNEMLYRYAGKTECLHKIWSEENIKTQMAKITQKNIFSTYRMWYQPCRWFYLLRSPLDFSSTQT